MPSAVLFFLCVALNVFLIWVFLSRQIKFGFTRLGASFLRVRLYFTRPLSEKREAALRRRSALLLRQVVMALLGLSIVALSYTPSLLFASYRSDWMDAFFSPEALAGMLAAAVLIAWRGRRR